MPSPEPLKQVPSILPNENNPLAYLATGRSLVERYRDEDAAKMFRRALLLDDNCAEARIELANLLVAHGNFIEAIPLFERAVRDAPNRTSLKLSLAQALTGAGDDAAEGYLLACGADPDFAGPATGMLGYWYQARGRSDEAKKCFEASIEANPVQGLAYYGWSQTNRFTSEADPILDRARAALLHPRLESEDETTIHYVLGKAYGDIGEYQASMHHYDLANKRALLQNLGGKPFDRKNYAQTIDATIATFRQETFRRFSGTSLRTKMPIFVVGMMRSGTTLVEQILAAHPNVFGAGELGFWLDESSRAFDIDRRSVQPKELEKLARTYLSTLIGLANNHEHVVDKMPQNFQMVGLIHLAFPDAPIVHIRRHPVDTCLSIYTTAYQQSPAFAHDKASIVFAYRQYQRLTDHWRKVIPANRFLEIDYEELVSNFEPECRRIVQFCRLPWDDACLRPQENKSVVTTPSLWQVRQPIYRTAIAKWQPYEPYLGDFATLLTRTEKETPQ